ncbi:TPA: FGGY family carbohydrate kinase, partial [Klebsiella pneumoniae]
MDFYLGIDIGTSRVKAVLFDQHFTACASAAENTSPRLSANGYAEQDMTQLWHSVLAILRQIARSHELMSDLLRRPGFDRRYFADTGTHLQPCNT